MLLFNIAQQVFATGFIWFVLMNKSKSKTGIVLFTMVTVLTSYVIWWK